jgi:hypothetical protein
MNGSANELGSIMSQDDIDFIVTDLRRALACIAGDIQYYRHEHDMEKVNELRGVVTCIAGTMQLLRVERDRKYQKKLAVLIVNKYLR